MSLSRWFKALFSPGKAMQIDADGKRVSYWMLLSNFGYALVPFIMVAGTLYTIWWYVVIHQQADVEAAVTGVQQLGTPGLVTAGRHARRGGAPARAFTGGSGASPRSAR